jgi:predicted lysophospholipase L1 biosynthesis ABC-type transport system permease subunit
VDKSERATVIGVVKDAKYRALRDEAPRTIYLQFPPPRIGTTWNFQLQIWTALNPGALASSVRSAFQRENPQVSVEIHTFHELLGRHLLYERLLTAIAISFGSLGLLMAAMGVYGAAAYPVSRRTMEIGIRVALGATKRQVVKVFVRDHSLVTCVGITVGVLTALGLTQVLHAWLFGVSSRDVSSLAVSIFLLAGVSVAAILIPTARALRVEPLHLLRGE